MRRLLRMLGWIALLLVVALATLVIVLETEWGHERVRRMIQARVSELLAPGVTVEIGRLRGSFFGDARIEGAVVRDRDGTVVMKADEIVVRFDLWPLAKHRVVLNELSLLHPVVRWPLGDIWKKKEASGTGGGAKWLVEIQRARVLEGFARVQKVGAIAQVEGDGSLLVGAGGVSMHLAHVRGIWLERGLDLTGSGHVSVGGKVVAAAGVDLRSAGGSSVHLPLGLYDANGGGFTGVAEVRATESDLRRVRPSLPAIGGAVEVAGGIARGGSERPIDAHVVARAGDLVHRLTFDGVIDRSLVRGELEVRGLKTGKIALDGNARLDLKGSPRSPETLLGSATVAIWGAIGDTKLDVVTLEAQGAGGVFHGRLEAATSLGRAAITADVADDGGKWFVRGARVRAAGDLSRLPVTLTGAGAQGKAEADLSARGPIDALEIEGTIDGAAVRTAKAAADELHARVALRGIPSAPAGSASVKASGFELGKAYLGPIEVNGTFEVGTRRLDVRAMVGNDASELALDATARVIFEPGMTRVAIGKLRARTRDLVWTGGGELDLGGGRITARSVALASPAGRIAASGTIAPAGPDTAATAQLRLVGLDVERLRAAHLWEGAPLAGMISLDARLDRAGHRLSASGEVVAHGVVVAEGAPAIDASLRAQLAEGRLVATGHVREDRTGGLVDLALELATPRDVLDPRAWRVVDLDRSLRSVRIALRDLDVHSLAMFSGRSIDVAGRVSGVIASTASEPGLTLALSMRGLSAGAVHDVDLDVTGTWDHASLRAEGRMELGDRAGVDDHLSGDVTFDARLGAGLHALLEPRPGAALAEAPLQARATVRDYDLERLAKVVPLTEPVSGRLRATLDVMGTAHAPTGHAHTEVAEARLAFIRFLELSADARLDGDLVTARLHAAQATGGELDAQAKLDRAGTRSLDLTAHARSFDLAFLSTLSSERTDLFAGVRGQLDADVRARAAGGAFDAEGSIHVRDGQFHTEGGVRVVDRIELQARLAGDRVIVDKLVGRSAPGSIDVRGQATFAGLQPSAFTAKIKAKRVPVTAGTRVLAATFDGDVRGARRGADWDLTATLAHAVVDVPKDRDVGRLQSTAKQADVVFTDVPLVKKRASSKGTLHVAVRTPDGVQITGQDQRLELREQLELYVHGGDVALSGGIEARSGFIMLFGRRFDVVHANLSFERTEKATNPRLDIRIEHDFQTATVYVDVTGRLASPRLALSSEPPSYDQAQLLGYVLGGDPDDPAIGQMPLGAKAVGVASTMVLGQVQNQLKSVLPLDVLSVQVGEGTDTSTTSLEVGKWLNEKFFVGYRRRINAPDTKNLNEATVEYRLARRWLVDAFFGDRGVGGADVLWSKRF